MSRLSEIQGLVVESTAKRLAVIAGAGSGKSRVIEHRIKRMIQDGVKSRHIAAITFTRFAAGVLTERIDQPLGYVGTLHSFILGLINGTRMSGGLDRLKVADDDFCDYIFDKVKSQHRSKVSRKKFDENRLTKERRRPTAEQELVKAYEREMIENLCVDFDLILKFGLKLINQGLLNIPYKHLFVDEYQDSGETDNAIYETLIDRFHIDTITIVGDMNQSIYGFRGGCPENLSEKRDDPRWTVLSLYENYRSDKRICEVANRVYKDTALAMTPMMGNVILREGSTRFLDEAEAIKKAIALGIPEHEIAIIIRTNHLVDEYKKSLSSMGFNVMSVSWIGPKDWKRMKTILGMHVGTPSLGRCMHYLKEIKGAPEDELKRISRECDKRGSIELAVMRCGLHATPREDMQVAAISQESLYYYGQAADGCDHHEETLMALREIELGFSRKTEGISVRTVHSAKGGEWDFVILPELLEKVFPLNDSEDERRLFYVAITRARHFLYVTVPSTRIAGWGMPTPSTPSRFTEYLKGIGDVKNEA